MTALATIAFALMIMMRPAAPVLADQPMTAASIEESMAIGNGLVAALNEYYLTHNIYPTDLSLLASDGYVEFVPQPTAGALQWAYSTFEDGTEFKLEFGSNAFSNDNLQLWPSWAYYSTERKWYSHD